MTARFVLDEWSWAAATGADAEVLSNAIHQLLERLDAARERNEGVAKHMDYYETALGEGVKLFSVLFKPDCPVQLDRDLAVRLSLALDQAIKFDDARLIEYDAEIEGSVRFAPGVAWAHVRRSERRQVSSSATTSRRGTAGPGGMLPWPALLPRSSL